MPCNFILMPRALAKRSKLAQSWNRGGRWGGEHHTTPSAARGKGGSDRATSVGQALTSGCGPTKQALTSNHNCMGGGTERKNSERNEDTNTKKTKRATKEHEWKRRHPEATNQSDRNLGPNLPERNELKRTERRKRIETNRRKHGTNHPWNWPSGIRLRFDYVASKRTGCVIHPTLRNRPLDAPSCRRRRRWWPSCTARDSAR